MNPETFRRCALIGGIVVVMALFVIIFGQLLLAAPGSSTQSSSDEPIPGTSPELGPLQDKDIPFHRNLETFYGRRQYPGAPPIIPHPILKQFGGDENIQCKSCHAEGGSSGYVNKYIAHAPVTPHENLSACQQCHVPQRTSELFKKNDWKSVRPPNLGESALPGSPAPIPHRLQMRQTCADCHAGPAAVKTIKTDHPERSYCVQCHVPKNSDATWSRSDDE